jgi:hypothetical protein
MTTRRIDLDPLRANRITHDVSQSELITCGRLLVPARIKCLRIQSARPLPGFASLVSHDVDMRASLKSIDRLAEE